MFPPFIRCTHTEYVLDKHASENRFFPSHTRTHIAGISHMQWGGHNYFLSWREPWHKFEDWDWFNGRNFCRDRCMDLVSFDTPGEYQLFAAIMQQGEFVLQCDKLTTTVFFSTWVSNLLSHCPFEKFFNCTCRSTETPCSTCCQISAFCPQRHVVTREVCVSYHISSLETFAAPSLACLCHTFLQRRRRRPLTTSRSTHTHIFFFARQRQLYLHLRPQVQLQGQGLRRGAPPAHQRQRMVLGRGRQHQDPVHEPEAREHLLEPDRRVSHKWTTNSFSVLAIAC